MDSHVIIDIQEECKGKPPARVSRKEWALLFFVCASTFAFTVYVLFT